MRKIVSITLAMALAATTAVTTFAVSAGKITGMTESLSLGYSSAAGQTTVDLGTVYPQDERIEYIDLYDSMFSWDSDYLPSATPTMLTTGQIRDAKLTAKVTNSRVVRDVSVNAREGRVEVVFPKELVGTKEIDFDFEVILSIDGRRQSDHGMSFTGTLANPVIDVYAGYDTVDISDGSVAEAQEYVSKIALELGDGVSYVTNLSKGKRVYATATRTPGEEDERLMKEHPSIHDVVTLTSTGLGANGYLKLDGSYGKSHVYDADLNYLGDTTEQLPYASKYYFSSKKLEIAEDAESSAADNEPVTSSQSSQSSAAPAAANNVNANPMTGR